MIGSIPMLRGLAGFNRDWLRRDIPAVTIAAVGRRARSPILPLPPAPPETGIYASIVAPIAYAIFGPSRLLVVGPEMPPP